ncbi:MAG: hypothetical protein RRA92_03450 [Gemmatimonadota bacterium]|nr:hypothetical protein [Gemmatimonadota bacterium]
MPSEETIRSALGAVAGAREDFRNALVRTVDQLRGSLVTRESDPDGTLRRTGAELGPFAAGRIDPARFASLLAPGDTLDPDGRTVIERAVEVLSGLLDQGDDLFVARLPEGGRLVEAVRDALAEAGRAFGAARCAELARTGRFRADDHREWLDRFPPEAWSRRERDTAPPLVVSLRGSDLRPAGLSDLLDGVQKLVLVVDGEAPPAALARCVSPGVHVLQCADAQGLGALADAEGPAVVAIVPGGAEFAHRPAGDGARGLRLTVSSLPEREPKRALGSISVWRQVDDLRLLRALAAPGGGAGAADAAGDGAAAGPATDADLLAAWILRQGGAAAS